MLGGRICRWLLLFQEFDLEVVVKPGKHNVGLDHLLQIQTGEAATSLNDELPDAQLFRVKAIPDQLAEIAEFLITSQAPIDYTPAQRWRLVTCSDDYQLIVDQLYKLGVDGILRCRALEHERDSLLYESHEGIVEAKMPVRLRRVGLWWPSLFAESKDYWKHWDIVQHIGKPCNRDELSLFPVIALEPFNKWAIDFVGPINPSTRRIRARYTITAIEYLTGWIEATPIKDCTTETTMCFIFENIITWFRCPKVLMSDQGSHFVKETIQQLTQEFMIHHQKNTPYHPQANDTMEAFNKILEHALTNVCNVQLDDWDQYIPTVLWAYRTTCKRLMKHMPFWLVYGKEAVILLECGS